jgi:hypothetical protein
MPAPPSLSEAEEAFAEGFLDDILLCLPILGYALFETAETATAGTAASDSGGVTLHLRAKGIEATGNDTPAGFIVRAGSKAVRDDKMVRQNVLVPDGECLRLIQDYLFASPSLAAGVMLGRPANGRVEWKTPDGRTLKDIQDIAAAG